jgi:hypothetical protein
MDIRRAFPRLERTTNAGSTLFEMNEGRNLLLHDGPTEGWGSFWPVKEPAFRGVADTGIDWLCPSCGTVLIRGAVHEHQFLDLRFRCYSCQAVGGSPARPPGRPLAGLPLLVPAGNYLLGSSVDTTARPVMCVGQQALDGYEVETGRGQPAVPVEISAQGLRDAADYAAELLGEHYDALLEADERGRSSPTPPARRHRLIELIRYARGATTLLDQQRFRARIDLDGNMLSELVTVVSLFRRWSEHPMWAKLVATLTHETEVQHSLMVLAVASYLVDAGNGVGIVGAASAGRIADLWAEPSLLERLDVEVKTPQDLRGPRESPLQLDEAVRVVERQVKKAASTRHGQLKPDGSGILALGAYHLGEGATDLLKAAAESVLRRQTGRKEHLAGIIVAELSYQTETVVDASGQVISTFGPTLENRLVRHPGYRGDLELHEGEPPWRQFSPQPPAAPQDSGQASRRTRTPSAAQADERRAKRKMQRDARRKNRRP